MHPPGASRPSVSFAGRGHESEARSRRARRRSAFGARRRAPERQPSAGNGPHLCTLALKYLGEREGQSPSLPPTAPAPGTGIARIEKEAGAVRPFAQPAQMPARGPAPPASSPLSP